MSLRELIVYATPTGALDACCGRYFAAAEGVGATTAQAFPAHCTLTGFFHRSQRRASEVIVEMSEQIREAGQPPTGSVRIVALQANDGWVGLVIESPWLLGLTASLISDHELAVGEDPLRPKQQLHLSLAYEVGDTTPYEELAERVFGSNVVEHYDETCWEVAVWERTESGRFLRH